MTTITLSALQMVRNTLDTRDDVTVVDVREVDDLPIEHVGSWSQNYSFYVISSQIEYQTGRGLQAFMMSLVPPDLEPTSFDSCEGFNNSLKRGVLYFDETIGTETTTRELALTSADIPQDHRGFKDGKLVIKTANPIQRRIRVHVFPDMDKAREVLQIGDYGLDGKESLS